jgi:hypothetical protein
MRDMQRNIEDEEEWEGPCLIGGRKFSVLFERDSSSRGQSSGPTSPVFVYK